MRSSTGVKAATPVVVRKASELQSVVAAWRRTGLVVGLVPTMGALHAGHANLIRAAAAENDRTVVSIFVNPLQFGAGEDFDSYPRPLEADRQLAGVLGASAVYAPTPGEMYPAGAATRIRVSGLSDVLEGVHRPGHFEGVATVVAKLFNACRPDRAYFGQKDAQQAAVVRRLASDLDTGIEIRVCPIVRDADGLALSSRNAYLNTEERQAALSLSRALRSANTAFLAGERDHGELRRLLHDTLRQELFANVDYAELVDPNDFVGPGQLAVLAVRIGRTRLIDNHLLGEPFAAALSG